MTLSPSLSSPTPFRGEVWWVKFNSPITANTPPANTPKANLPTTGDEIYKRRPAVVLNIQAAWRNQLYIVVPLTSWQEYFQQNKYFWMVKILADSTNKLPNNSAADTFQVKSVSILRFDSKLGILTTAQMDLITATIAFCIGYVPPKPAV